MRKPVAMTAADFSWAARLMQRGVSPRRACDVTVSRSLSDDPESQRAIAELVRAIFST